MAVILVQHQVSQQIVEIDEIHLAHPVLGPLYKPVRVNDSGKPYVLNPVDDDEPEDTGDDLVEIELSDGEPVDKTELPEPTKKAAK